jgi:hypothetical protein
MRGPLYESLQLRSTIMVMVRVWKKYKRPKRTASEEIQYSLVAEYQDP